MAAREASKKETTPCRRLWASTVAKNILAHCRKWAPVYQALEGFAVVVAVVVAVVAIWQTRASLTVANRSLEQNDEAINISRNALQDGKRALDLARESTELTRQQFRLRNRPIVIFRRPQFDGPGTDTMGTVHPRTIALEIVNASDVPATHVFAAGEIYINGKKVSGTSKIAAGVVIKGGEHFTSIFLTESVYAAATNEQNRFELRLTVSYSGMLGERPDQYSSRFRCWYKPKEEGWSYASEDLL